MSAYLCAESWWGCANNLPIILLLIQEKEIIPPSHSFLVIAGVLESTSVMIGAVFTRTL